MKRTFLLIAALTALMSNIHAAELQEAQPAAAQAAGPATPKAVEPLAIADLAAPTAAYVPMSNRQKFNWTVGSVVSPTWIFYSGVKAGLDQWQSNPPQWRQGASGYGRRFAAAHTLEAFDDVVWFAGAALTHEDVRYSRSTRTGFWPRTADALKLALMTRRDDGSIGFAYARTVAGLGTTMFQRVIYPDRPAFTTRSIGFSVLSYVGVREALSLMREFLPDILRGRGSSVTGIDPPANSAQPGPASGASAALPPRP